MPSDEKNLYTLEEKNVYSLDEICQRNNMSRKVLDGLWARGLGPKYIMVGARRKVLAKAEREWLQSLEHPTGKTKRVAEATVEMLRAKAKHASMIAHRRQA